MATIRYLPDIADRAALVGAIEAAGYDVRDRWRTGTGHGPDVAGRGAVGRGRRTRGARSGRSCARRSSRSPWPSRSWSRCSCPRRASRWRRSTGWRSSRRPSSRSGRAPVLSRGLAGRPSRHGQHGHARRDRDDRGLGVQRRRDALPGRHPRGRAAPGDLLRFLDDHHRPRPAGSLAGGTAPKASTTGAIRRLVGLAADDRAARERRPRRRTSPLEVVGGRRPAARPAGREGAGRRRRRRGRLRGRRLDAHRRADPGRGRPPASRSSGRPSTRPARS